MEQCIPGIKQVAVMDTAFHQSMPKENFMYATPICFYEDYNLRKYGFHGTSYQYITKRMQELFGNENPNIIVCHIGSGASITAIKEGKSFDTTMGLTPLDGLMMGTRSGSLDPAVITYIMNETGKSAEEVIRILNKESGLQGITGKSDLRDVLQLAEEGDEKALLAKKMYTNIIYKTIGQYYFELDGNIDAIVFTAGVGENAIGLREIIIDRLSNVLPLELDPIKNESTAGYLEKREGTITTEDSVIPVYVVPTNEERMILEDTIEVISKQKSEKKVYEKK